MIKLLAPLIRNRNLTAQNLPELTNFGFLDCFDIDTLCLSNCPNITFDSLPKKVKHLSITNSHLRRIDGLSKMTWLESLDLQNNDLIKCEPLANLKLL